MVIGEREETIVELLKHKLNGLDCYTIKGIAFRESAKILINERRKPIKHLDSIPFPEWSMFPMEKYSTCLQVFGMEQSDKALPIITSMGGC